jgi:hypothetical protein
MKETSVLKSIIEYDSLLASYPVNSKTSYPKTSTCISYDGKEFDATYKLSGLST